MPLELGRVKVANIEVTIGHNLDCSFHPRILFRLLKGHFNIEPSRSPHQQGLCTSHLRIRLMVTTQSALYESRRFASCSVSSVNFNASSLLPNIFWAPVSKGCNLWPSLKFRYRRKLWVSSFGIIAFWKIYGMITVYTLVILLHHYQLRLYELWGSHFLACLLLARLTLRPWRLRQLVPPKRMQFFFSDYTVKSQKIALLNTTSVCYCSRMQSPWRKILKKLIVWQLVKKFTAFYGTWWLITLFTRAGHWSWTRPVVPKLGSVKSSPVPPVFRRAVCRPH